MSLPAGLLLGSLIQCAQLVLIYWLIDYKMRNIISLSASQPYNNVVFDVNIDTDGTIWIWEKLL